ncbi:polyphosphate kinase, partial [Yersinia kristensenii]|nr:polyphosphate kinase [Yersinia kristensenii]
MLSEVCKERLEYLASLKGHVGQAVTMCRVELSDISTELLSLREQLAELKALEPVA